LKENIKLMLINLFRIIILWWLIAAVFKFVRMLKHPADGKQKTKGRENRPAGDPYADIEHRGIVEDAEFEEIDNRGE